jgi:hypothetical protein
LRAIEVEELLTGRRALPGPRGLKLSEAFSVIAGFDVMPESVLSLAGQRRRAGSPMTAMVAVIG